MTRLMLVAALLIFVFSTPSWADTNPDGGCSAPSTAESTSAVDVPQYAPPEEEDDTPDPAEESRKDAWKIYEQEFTSSLKASSDPRDWAIAVAIESNLPSEADRAAAITLLRKAAKDSSNDALAQWIVLSAARHLNATDVVAESADRLVDLEPDNAAVWMEILQRAAANHDRAGVTAALGRMAATSRMDNHYSDLMKSVTDTVERHPIPDELIAEVGGYSSSAMPYIFAVSVAAASALPAYQFLTTACVWDSSGRNADRAEDCEHVGRTMAQRGDTLLSQLIGFAVLRVSRTFNDDDIEAARQMDWLSQNLSDLAVAPGRVAIFGDAIEAEMYQKDWVETGSETEAMRRRIVRAGFAPTPPDSWVGKAPRFSAERIQQDEENSAAILAKATY